MQQKLTRSQYDRKLLGVCGGWLPFLELTPHGSGWFGPLAPCAALVWAWWLTFVAAIIIPEEIAPERFLWERK